MGPGPTSPVSQILGCQTLGLVRVLLLVLGTLALFGPFAARGDFGFDDRETIHQNRLVHAESGERVHALQAFGQDYWHHMGDAGLYRPLVTLSLRWQVGALGPNARLLHVSNLLLHVWVLGLLLLACYQAFAVAGLPMPGWTALALALFAWHPLQSEAVLWIAGRSSSLCAFVGLLPLFLWHSRLPQWRPALAFFGSLAPLLVKEDGLAFAAFYWVLLGRRHRLGQLAILSAGGLYLWLRWQALGANTFGDSHGPWQDLGLGARLASGLQALAFAMGSLLWPVEQPLVMQPDSLRAWFSEGWSRAWLGVLAGLGALWLVWRARRSQLSPWLPIERAAFAGFLVSLLPWLQIVPAPELFAPRFVYLPLLFGALFLPRLWISAWPQQVVRLGLPNRPMPRLALIGFWILCFFGVRPMAPAFGSALGYWEYRTEVDSMDAIAWNGLAQEALRLGDLALAKQALVRSTELRPGYSRAWVGLATWADRSGQRDLSRSYLDRAVDVGPRNPVALGNRARMHALDGEWRCSAELYGRACELQPGRGTLWRGLARANIKLGQRDAARANLTRALELQPGDAATLQLLGRLAPED